MENGMEFFTATCLNWQHLLAEDLHKRIIVSSLDFLVANKRIWVYGFVPIAIGMPNHIHLLWCKQDAWIGKNIQQLFLKYTAQQIKLEMEAVNHPDLPKYVSSQADRKYQFWERRPYIATMYNRQVAEQKLDYIHNNPVKANLCVYADDYEYSSAAFYKGGGGDTVVGDNIEPQADTEVGDNTKPRAVVPQTDRAWAFLTHYMEHI